MLISRWSISTDAWLTEDGFEIKYGELVFVLETSSGNAWVLEVILEVELLQLLAEDPNGTRDVEAAWALEVESLQMLTEEPDGDSGVEATWDL